MSDAHSCKNQAERAAAEIRGALDVRHSHPVCVILGTGWGDALELEDARGLPFSSIPGFSSLQEIAGHARRVECGKLAGREILALRGRVHLNEHPNDPEISLMVRLQTEMLIAAGVQTLIVTCAAGSLNTNLAPPRHVCVTDGFVTMFAPPMPLFAGEFCSPEDALDRRLIEKVIKDTRQPGHFDKWVAIGGHVMVRGPFFEGRRYDKQFLASTGARTVGMSTLPEACVAALFGAKVLALAYVSNDDKETHSHEENVRRAREDAEYLSAFIESAVRLIPQD